jgi:hypothetical protein
MRTYMEIIYMLKKMVMHNKVPTNTEKPQKYANFLYKLHYCVSLGYICIPQDGCNVMITGDG